MADDTRRGTNVFVCSYTDCARFFHKKSRLLIHLRSHTGERPYVCNYEDCIKSYSRAAHLKRHIEFSHTRPEDTVKLSWRCPYEECGLIVANKYSLAKHIKRRHETEVKRFFCQVEGCDKECKSEKQLKRHERDVHCINQFRCTNAECGKVFSCESKLKAHYKVHAGYQCTVEGCSLVLKSWSLLRKHVAVEHTHDTDLVCPVCGKKFVNKSNMKMHMKVHMDERTMFECTREGCGRVYLDKRNLTAHIRSYHDGKRFPCIHEGCPRTFSCKKKMLLHLPLHDPNRPLPKKKRKKKVVVPGADPPVKKKRKRRRRRHVAESLCGIDVPGSGISAAETDDDDKVVLSSSDSEAGPRVRTDIRSLFLFTDLSKTEKKTQDMRQKPTATFSNSAENMGMVEHGDTIVDSSEKVLQDKTETSRVTNSIGPDEIKHCHLKSVQKAKKKYPHATVVSAESEVLSELDGSLILKPSFMKSSFNNHESEGSGETSGRVPRGKGLILKTTADLDDLESIPLEISQQCPSNVHKGKVFEDINDSVVISSCQSTKNNSKDSKVMDINPVIYGSEDVEELMYPRTACGDASQTSPESGKSGPVVAWDIKAFSKAGEVDEENIANGDPNGKRIKLEIKKCVILNSMTDLENCGLSKTVCVPVAREIMNSEVCCPDRNICSENEQDERNLISLKVVEQDCVSSHSVGSEKESVVDVEV